MYPPGQFAAWNRGLDAARHSGPHPGPPDRAPAGDQPSPNQPGRTPGGAGQAGPLSAGVGQAGRQQPVTAQPGSGRPGAAIPGPVQPGAASGGHVPPGQSQAETGYRGPDGRPGSPDSDAPAASRYYANDLGSGAEPGYSLLAVSDPAADVTSTQTWRAVDDGRATGVWTAPARPDADPASRDKPAGHSNAGSPPAEAVATAAVAQRPQPGGDTGDDSAVGRVAEPVRRSGRGHSGAHSSPSQVQRAQRRGQRSAGSDAAQDPASAQRRGERSAGPDQPQSPASPQGPRRTTGRQRAAGAKRRKRPASVTLAIATALVLVLAAVTALSYAVLRGSAKPKPNEAAGKPAPTATVSASPSPSLGPYGHIGTRKADPQPLTVAELYPATYTVGGATVVRTATNHTVKCGSVVVGAKIHSAIRAAGCDQVIRATYVSSARGLMGTVGVLNLSTAKGAKAAAGKADARDFISQLAGKNGPTRKIGRGTGIEEAAAKGHYLILIWAEFTNLRKPKTTAQRTQVVQFMTELLKNTANVSLATRMVAGTP